jgi:hypothetical protein
MTAQQFQLDVYGEVIDTLHVAARYGLRADDDAWRMLSAVIDFWGPPGKNPTRASGRCAAHAAPSCIHA